MAKTEYYEPKLLPGEKEQPGILVDAVALLELYLRALPMMNATDRKGNAKNASKPIRKDDYNYLKYHTKNGKTTTYYNGGFVPLPAPGAA